ncbi:triose or hexose phosphate/phosphate translocator, putative [Babesia bigemina]|uniref:Triose or hexose phosphate/phosphate translocator, putative n=1 Tax=Babesia bigemina TaxID=5866 RepID=A0A061DCZ2_BABBI|nr:triose or hexose phosphate/phosphate translocator, putative [Babesia bigemina]CDR98092.1 triose or hexose phosphate/phosphate translocator, putative [Babesia bigemina]|eukprot:XP_012770278.1 triose or hexose phosphate/phosphate translocator, putative [Babesia bigemina]
MEVNQKNVDASDVAFANLHDEEYERALPASAFPEKRTKRTWIEYILGLDWWLIIGFVLWYAQNACYVVFNKLFLNELPLPWTLSAFQLLIGWFFMIVFWGCNIRDKPNFDNVRKFFVTFLPMSFLHFLVHVSAVISMGLGAISFTHVVKALEPVITVILSMLCLHEFMNVYAYLALIPIVGGVALASIKELNFSIGAFLFAMLSNVAGATRSILAKVTLKNKADIGENLTANNIYMILTLIASLISLPFLVGFEARHWIPVWTKATANMTQSEKLWLLFYGFASCFFYFLSNDSAFYCLGQINQVTYSVANTAKRVLLIASSIIVFKNKVTGMGYIGMIFAVLGTFVYSMVK